jgi:hypothetical protein
MKLPLPPVFCSVFQLHMNFSLNRYFVFVLDLIVHAFSISLSNSHQNKISFLVPSHLLIRP